jgi:hypothetical protein
LISAQTPTHELDTEISCLEGLFDDLRRLRLGMYPGADELAADGSQVTTGPVQILAVEKKSARAASGSDRLVPEGEG